MSRTIYQRRTLEVAICVTVLALAATVSIALGQQTSSVLSTTALTSAHPRAEAYGRLADETETNLKEQVLAKWYPRAIDTQRGGFAENFNEDWSPGNSRSKGIVYESRLTWTAAQAAHRFSEQAAEYTAAAQHGLKFLSEKMWDAENGGFFWAIDQDGNPVRGTGGNDGSSKQAYGNAFGIYAAAAVYQLNHDPEALALVQKGFRWFDEHAHDAEHGGYFEVLTRDGHPNAAAVPAVGGAAGDKSMNSSVHLLEALTDIYRIWPDQTVKSRLQEMFEIVRDKIAHDPGYLTLYFSADWKPKDGEDSYGHDVEAAYLLIEAADALGIPDDPTTWKVAKQLVDHALQVGWDKVRGGLYNSGGINGGNYARSREWWVEAESLNALLLMHQRYGETDPRYWTAFLAQWNWITQFGQDKTNGGWWPRVQNDGTPVRGAKSDAWTECYHQGRALLNVSERLRTLARTEQKK
jgi:mannobiose 2-epimerase